MEKTKKQPEIEFKYVKEVYPNGCMYEGYKRGKYR